ncbi:hematopoietic cell signal transducer [Hoplias malabaricus]|uniref:hematopoietic cell signal transducer n=1 Tax=Hoplias malabaricus TaxID=27720 RepID=UPI0034632299
MEDSSVLIIIFLSLVAMISAEETDSYCYQIAPATLAGLVLGDIALTIFIVAVTYFCASKRRQQKENADKVYMNVRANSKP